MMTLGYEYRDGADLKVVFETRNHHQELIGTGETWLESRKNALQNLQADRMIRNAIGRIMWSVSFNPTLGN